MVIQQKNLEARAKKSSNRDLPGFFTQERNFVRPLFGENDPSHSMSKTGLGKELSEAKKDFPWVYHIEAKVGEFGGSRKTWAYFCWRLKSSQ